MAFDPTVARACMIGVPIVCTDDPTAWAFGNFQLGDPFNVRRLLNRYIGQTAVHRAQPDAMGNTFRVAFGWDGPNGVGAPDDVGGAALCHTDFGPDSTVRLRYMTGGAFWIEHPCLTNSSATIYLYAGSATTAYARANLTGNMAFGCWVRPSSISASEISVISFASGGATRYPFELSYMSGGSNPKLRFRYTHSGGTAASADSSESASIAQNVWVHVGFRIAGTGLTFYINGAAAGTAVLAAATRDSANGANLTVGRGSGANYLLGRLSALTLWNSAFTWTTSNIHNVWANTNVTNTADPASLVLYFPFGHLGTPDTSYAEYEYSCAPAYDFDLFDDAVGAAPTAAYLRPAGGSLTYSNTRVGTGGVVTDTGAIAAFSGQLSARAHARQWRDLYALLSAAVAWPGTGAYQIDVTDPDGTTETRAIGRLLAGNVLQLSHGVSVTTRTISDPSILDITPRGQMFAQDVPRYRAQELSWAGLSSDETYYGAEEDFANMKGNTGDFFFVYDPTTRLYTERRDFLARCSSAHTFPFDGYNRKYVVGIEEVRG